MVNLIKWSISSSDTPSIPLVCILLICSKIFCRASINLSKSCSVTLSFCRSLIISSISSFLPESFLVTFFISSFVKPFNIPLLVASSILLSICFFSFFKSSTSSLFSSFLWVFYPLNKRKTLNIFLKALLVKLNKSYHLRPFPFNELKHSKRTL